MRKYEKLVYDIIYKEPRHLTAEDIYKELKVNYPKVVLASVYNNLKVLHEKKLIHKVVVEGMPERYDMITRHDHLICNKCGKLMDVSFKDLTKPLEKQLHMHIEGYDLNIQYVCPECQSK